MMFEKLLLKPEVHQLLSHDLLSLLMTRGPWIGLATFFVDKITFKKRRRK